MTFIPTLAAGLLAFVLTSALGNWLIPLLRKLKFGQTILDIGPRWHQDKQGTPTMGGILFLVGIVSAVLAGLVLLATQWQSSAYLDIGKQVGGILLGLVMAIAFAGIGFVDDYIKIIKKRNLGLTEKQKLVLQFSVAILYVAGQIFWGENSTTLQIPFAGQLNLGVFYYPLMVFGIVFIVNAVNITDGIDGLCGSVTLVTALGFLAIAFILQDTSMQMISAALAGGCLGFLVWNIFPAKVFMGDTGSFFLGGMIVFLAFGLRIPGYLILMGFIYTIEAISVLIQQSYFKYTRKKYGEGRRIFKMTPIHHQFELDGWSENKIVTVFSGIQVLACLLAILSIVQILS